MKLVYFYAVRALDHRKGQNDIFKQWKLSLIKLKIFFLWIHLNDEKYWTFYSARTEIRLSRSMKCENHSHAKFLLVNITSIFTGNITINILLHIKMYMNKKYEKYVLTKENDIMHIFSLIKLKKKIICVWS